MNERNGASDKQGASALSPALPDAGPDAPIAAVLDVLRRGSRFLVCSHAHPDGDAVGSMLAMGMLLRQMGKHADLLSADRVPNMYRGLPGVEALSIGQHARGPYDAVILLECGALARTHLRGLEGFFLVNIDHHASCRPFANLNWIDCDAVSAGQMVYRLAKAAGATITAEMANCLYTTILTDTGGFRYGALCASTFGMAQELVQAGADPRRIAQDVFFSNAASRFLLLGAALSNLKREGRIAWLWVSHRDMIRACAAEEDCEGVVNYAIAIAGVEAAIFLREVPGGQVRASLRSKGLVDVAAIASQYGGGGHRRAAGCSLEGSIPQALNLLVGLLRPRLSRLEPDKL